MSLRKRSVYYVMWKLNYYRLTTRQKKSFVIHLRIHLVARSSSIFCIAIKKYPSSMTQHKRRKIMYVKKATIGTLLIFFYWSGHILGFAIQLRRKPILFLEKNKVSHVQQNGCRPLICSHVKRSALHWYKEARDMVCPFPLGKTRCLGHCNRKSSLAKSPASSTASG